MPSLYHEETKKKGRSKATSACCKYTAQCHDRQSGEGIYDEEGKKKGVYRRNIKTKEKRGSVVVVVSDLSTWHYASPAHSKTVCLQSFDTAIPIAEPVLGGCPVVGHRIV
jgi:hypothetical protein